MDYLSLFTGAGGGDLAMQHLLGFRCLGYVEIDHYCQEVIKQRIADGLLDPAPIFGDIRRFISDGYAASYTGLVDVVSGGFPCQPFSVAGKRAGADDPRNMWPATIGCIRIIRPRFAFLENVPGLLNSGYFGRIIGDLAEAGYDARWCVLSAADCGAIHLRARLWIVAYSTMLDDTWSFASERRGGVGWSPKLGRHMWGGARPEPCCLDDGLPEQLGELKAYGNGQVPIVAATAWRLLTGDMNV